MEALSAIGLRDLMFIVPVVLLLHELEEWNIYDYHKKAYSEGVIEETRLGTRLWLLFLSMVGFAWTIVCYLIPSDMVATVLFMLLVDFCLLNAIQHIGMTVKTRKYNPGFVLGGVVGLLVNALVILKISVDAVIPQCGHTPVPAHRTALPCDPGHH
jgi:hypothetical protein